MFAVSHNLNEETIKRKKNLAFSISKNSMSMSNFSATENTNVESKSEMKVKYKMNHRNVKILQIFYSIYEKNILIKLLWLISI